MRSRILKPVCSNKQSQYCGKDINVDVPERLRTASESVCIEKDCVVYCDNCRSFKL
jgi:hypothetical protein